MKAQFSLLVIFTSMTCLVSCSKKKDVDGGGGASDGKIVYQTDFSNDDKKWFTGTFGDTISVKITGGNYDIKNSTSTELLHGTTSMLFDTVTGGSAIEAKLQVQGINGLSDVGYSGLVFNLNSNNGLYYIFDISSDGKFDVYGYPTSTTQKKFKWEEPSDAIKKTGDNVLRIESTEEDLHFFINGKEVYSMPANGLKLDVCGISADALSETKADYFKAYALP